jgi:hypothetical protein
MGLSPRTGRSFGFCPAYDSPGFEKGFGGYGRGTGFGRGMGLGRGRGYGAFAGYFHSPGINNLSREDEINMLKSQAEALKRSQQALEKRLGELEKESD